MVDFRPVAYVIGRILIVLAILMLAPAIIDWRAGLDNGLAFLSSAALTGVTGAALALSTANALGKPLDTRQAYLLTAGVWGVVPFFAALPFYLGAPGLTLVYAYFEAVSGITTTGASVIFGLAEHPTGMNLWRGMLNWLGGLGIVIIAMIFLPMMRIGGMQFFRTEGFDTFGKVLPRATDIARQLLLVYSVLTVVIMAVYSMLGMTPIAAVVHGMTTVSTGGFSTNDTSFSGYGPPIQYAAACFMFLASLPFIRYVQLVNGTVGPLWRDVQVRAYFRWLMTAVLIATLYRLFTSNAAWETAFRESLFNLTSIMSSTGFGAGSFPAWGSLVLVIAYVLGVVGACSGSTAAGLSVFRIQLSLAVLGREIRRIGNPSSVDPIRYDGRPVKEDVLNALILFVSSFILILGIMTVAIALTGVDTVSALFAAWTTLGNIGYGFGPMLERTGTFIDFPPAAIMLMTLCMILGRLGLLAILVMVLPSFWRR